MNQDLMCNLYSQAQYYQPNFYFPPSQFLQFSNIDPIQIPTMPIPQYRYDTPIFLNNGITQQTIETQNIMNTVQNNHSTEVDYEVQEKCYQIQDDSSSRVNGHWTKQEHLQYLEFVKTHEQILRSKYEKKSKKIFKLMSQYIPTRTATQCRSHHQKFNPLSKSKKKNRQMNKIPSVIHQ